MCHKWRRSRDEEHDTGYVLTGSQSSIIKEVALHLRQYVYVDVTSDMKADAV